MTRGLDRLAEEIVTCRKCPRLITYTRKVGKTKRKMFREQEYWAKPVPGFGDQKARVLIIGLAPAAHGANRTGRMFTGDSSGTFLIKTLHKFGFANKPTTTSPNDGLMLRDVYLTAVLRCAPPGNKPRTSEIKNCLSFLERELKTLKTLKVVLTLGAIAMRGYLYILKEKGIIASLSKYPFGHNQVYKFPGNLPVLVTSYHPSRQNTQTGRLSERMFEEVFMRVLRLLKQGNV